MNKKKSANASRRATITFWGGAGEVTGSNFLLETENLKIIVDCGLFQGCDTCDDKSRNPFPYDPKAIDYLFVTHAHLDHIGRIPKLVKDGFKGVIYSTSPTRDLAELALVDSLKILKEEARRNTQLPLYEKEDVKQTMALWKTISYHEQISLGDDLFALLKDAGHILGSSMVLFSRDGKTLVFTGDLGNSPVPLLRDTESIAGADYLIMESVYGDRVHESKDKRREMLEDVIEETVFRKGVLLIPAFSIERTQEILFEIENMMEVKKITFMPVFVDSPLAIQATTVYKRHNDYFNKEVKYIINSGNELFSFKGLRFIQNVEESKKIHETLSPKIIIAGSGMSVGGRIVYHEKLYLSDPHTTILIVGYQAPKSLGRDLVEGVKKVFIENEEIEVNARIVEITGYSSHKDSDALLQFVEKGADSLKKVFVVMGEVKSATFLTQRLRDHIGVNATAPRAGESAEINF